MRLPALRAVGVSVVAALLCVPLVAGPGSAATTAGASAHEQGGGSAAASRTLVAEAPPTAWIARLPTWTLSNDVTVRWGATPGGAAVDNFDVRVRRARWNLAVRAVAGPVLVRGSDELDLPDLPGVHLLLQRAGAGRRGTAFRVDERDVHDDAAR